MGILTDKYIKDLSIDAGDNTGWINIKEYERYQRNKIRKQAKQYSHLSKNKRKQLQTVEVASKEKEIAALRDAFQEGLKKIEDIPLKTLIAFVLAVDIKSWSAIDRQYSRYQKEAHRSAHNDPAAQHTLIQQIPMAYQEYCFKVIGLLECENAIEPVIEMRYPEVPRYCKQHEKIALSNLLPLNYHVMNQKDRTIYVLGHQFALSGYYALKDGLSYVFDYQLKLVTDYFMAMNSGYESLLSKPYLTRAANKDTIKLLKKMYNTDFSEPEDLEALSYLTPEELRFLNSIKKEVVDYYGIGTLNRDANLCSMVSSEQQFIKEIEKSFEKPDELDSFNQLVLGDETFRKEYLDDIDRMTNGKRDQYELRAIKFLYQNFSMLQTNQARQANYILDDIAILRIIKEYMLMNVQLDKRERIDDNNAFFDFFYLAYYIRSLYKRLKDDDALAKNSKVELSIEMIKDYALRCKQAESEKAKAQEEKRKAERAYEKAASERIRVTQEKQKIIDEQSVKMIEQGKQYEEKYEEEKRLYLQRIKKLEAQNRVLEEDRNELVKLKRFLANEDTHSKSRLSLDEKIVCIQKYRIVCLTGIKSNENKIKVLKELFPGFIYVTNETTDFPDDADYLIVDFTAIDHSMYDRAIRWCKRKKVNYGYIRGGNRTLLVNQIFSLVERL